MSTTVFLLCVWTAFAAKLGGQACKLEELDLGHCPSISAPDTSTIECNSNGDSIKCLATCANGYRFEDLQPGQEFDFSCNMTSGEWTSDTLPLCVDSTCNAAEPEHGFTYCDDIDDKTRVCSVECDADYRRTGPHMFMCDKRTGVWSPQLKELNKFPSCINGAERCANMRFPAGGVMACNVTDGEQRCYPNCPAGFRFSSPIPEEGYYTCIGGKWFPSGNSPDCEESAEEMNNVGEGHYTGIYTNMKSPADFTGMCFTWGQHHYKTFDGTIFRFNGNCQYLLARDFPGDRFQVHVKNDPDCDGSKVSCTREVIIIYGGEELTLKKDDGEPAAFIGDNKLILPENIYGLSVTRTAEYIIVKDYNSDLMVKWDGAEQIWVKVNDEMYDKVVGLCGTFNGQRDDDFSVLNGDEVEVVDNLNTFTQAWITSAVCVSKGIQPYCQWGPSATFTEKLLTGRAIERCSYIMETECKAFVDPNPYFEACKEDSCFYGGDRSAVCNSMAAYFRECTKRGIHINWREPGRCEVSCPFGMVFDNCGTSCPKTCSGLEYNCEDHHCIDGCHCPADTYLQDGQCLEKSDCPCMFGNKAYAPKSKIRRDCNQCVCSRGKWICTRNVCDGVCRTYGDRHYQTFDGASYNMRVDSDCSYILARSSEMENIPFEISVENKKCTNNVNGHKKWQVCTRNLIVKVDGHTMELKSGGMVKFGDKEVSLPFVKDNIAVEDVTSKYQKVTIWNGMTILWDKKLQIFIRARSNMAGKMAGLCGNFNSNQDDDFWAPDGVTHEDVYEFASLWQRRVCVDAPKIDPLLEHPCDTFAVNKRRAKEECGRLRDYEFLACHDVVDYQPYYESCLYDYCNMPMNTISCDVFSTYSLECAKHGVVLDWRSTSTCEEEVCPANEVWAECARSCFASCGAIANEIPCNEECVPGCTCEEGYVRGYDETCVPVSDCPCYFDDVKYLPGESRMLDCNVCECFRGAWECTDNYCPVNDTCGDNEEFVLCKWDKQTTCFAMHLPYEEPVKPEHCMSGCQCVEGYVLDEVSGTCVEPENCPCVYGGKSYREGETMRKDCNTCNCKGGMWECTEEQCSSQCRMYGPSHVTTYDGLNYMISQDCVYTLTESTEDNPKPFDITVENIPCGTMGIACGKCITMRINPGTPEEDSLILAKGKPVTVTKGSAFSTRYAGLYIFIDTNIGITIQWDKGTHVIVKLQPEHSGKVRGLCGDFDNNSGNDLAHKDNAPTSDKTEIIASWQTETCDAGQDLSNTDMCASNPHRRAWAEARCAVIKNTFKDCHSHVLPEPYYQRCVFDACGCDSGGDCDCFCTAVAAYANECNRKGVHVYWRTQDMCPMQCEGYRKYDPCESACPITCENYHIASKVKAECQDSCVEGCACKGDLIYDREEKCCVDSLNCICTVIAGVAYGEGDKIWSMSDECKSCYCMGHEVHCLGLPCPVRMEPPEMPCTIKYWKAPAIESKKYNPFRLKPSEEQCSLEIDIAIESCPVEMRDMCGYRCDQLCHSWSAATYQCIHGKADECCLTCGETIKSCPNGQRLRNETTCVPIDDCTCILPNGNVLAPGDSWDCRTTCTKYTCWHNTLKTSIIHSCKQELELLPMKVDNEIEIVDTTSYECYTAQAINYEEKEIITKEAREEEEKKKKEELHIAHSITVKSKDESPQKHSIDCVGVPAIVSDNTIDITSCVSEDYIPELDLYSPHQPCRRGRFTFGFPCGNFNNNYASCYGADYASTPVSFDHSNDVRVDVAPCSFVTPSFSCFDDSVIKDHDILSVCGSVNVCTKSDDGTTTVCEPNQVICNYDGTPCYGGQVFRDICHPSVVVSTPCAGQYYRGVPCHGARGSTIVNNYHTCGDSDDDSDVTSVEVPFSAEVCDYDAPSTPYCHGLIGQAVCAGTPSVCASSGAQVCMQPDFRRYRPCGGANNFFGFPCGLFNNDYAPCYGGDYVSTPVSFDHSSDVKVDGTPCSYVIPSVPCFDGPVIGDHDTLSVCGSVNVRTESEDGTTSVCEPSTVICDYDGTPCYGGQVFRDICHPSVVVSTPCAGQYYQGVPCHGARGSTIVNNYHSCGESDEDSKATSVDVHFNAVACDDQSSESNSDIPVPDDHVEDAAISVDIHDSSSICFDEPVIPYTSLTCPGVSDIPCDVSCPTGLVYDGYRCVNIEDCPCTYKDVRHKSGSVWKEDDGCVNCICIGGHSNCVAQTCDVTSCEPGYALIEVDGECCPRCLKTNVTCSDETHEIGEVWHDDCDVCTCTEYGVVKCEHVDCPATTPPECPASHELVQKVGECCPKYECVCNTDLCDTTEPTCPAHHKVVASLTDGCCPEYQCVCDADSCPAIYCAADEKKLLVGSDGCCTTYRCERAGCLDTTGGWRHIGEIFTCPFNPCTTCSCNTNGGLTCSANTCPTEEASFCASGSAPTEELSEDGCCRTYVCDCQCAGMDMNWNTFDNKAIASTEIGVSRLVEDSATGEFEIFMTRMESGALTAVESFEIIDNIGCNTLKVASLPKIFINEEEIEISPGNSIRKSGFRLGVDSANKVSVEVLASGVTLSLSQGGREWSVVVPTTYRGRTSGLCGLCDGLAENDLWDGHKVLSTTDEFLQHYAIDVVSTSISIPECTEGNVCEEMIEMFSSCPVDKTKYIDSCRQDICSGGSACNVLAGLASACRDVGLCIEWRSDSFCPYECPTNMEYRACGSSVVRTCDNYKDISIDEKMTSEGCFCSGDMVLIDGKCSAPVECPVYTDTDGKTHCVGDIFISAEDSCSTTTVLSDGSLVNSPIECAEPLECADSEVRVVVGESNCCPAYECLPLETCKGVVCPAYDDLTCDVGEEVQTIVHDECCVEMQCVCNTEKCPALPVPHCEDGETLIEKTSTCCTTHVCECNPDECHVPLCNGDGYHLEVVESGRCCPVYECVCDRSHCPAAKMPVCELGEVRSLVRTSDCCVSYECSCDQSKCPTAKEDCPEGYVLTKRTVENACCPEVYECQCDESVCPVESDLYCDSNAGYKRITTTSPRFAYTLPSCCPMQYEQLCVCDSSLCPAYEDPICGIYESVEYKSASSCCVQPQCVCDSSKCKATDTWCPSHKHATITLVDGCCEEVTCVCNECVAPEECKDGFIVTEYTDDCGCLKRHCDAPDYCVYNGDNHEPGTTWSEDLCVECSCSSDPDATGEYCVECRNIQCGTCSSGFTYVPVAGACCGDCVPVTCHYDGQEYAVGQSWSQDGGVCSTCTCEMNPVTGEVYSTCVNTTCPPIDPSCAEEDIVTTEDGCCTYCKPKPATPEPSSCSPMEETHLYLEYDGCTTAQNVTLATCSGSCVSMSTFSVEDGKFVKSCSCCTAVDTKDIEVSFNCPDGSTFTKTYQSAATCECHASNCSEP